MRPGAAHEPAHGAAPAGPGKPAGPAALREALKKVTPIDVLIALFAVGLVLTFWLPRRWAAGMAANEERALATVRDLARAQGEFKGKQSPPVFAASIDALLASGVFHGPHPDGGLMTKDGYRFRVGTLDDAGTRYYAVALPLRYGATGERSFYVDDTGVVRVSPGPVTGPAFPEIQ